MPATACGKGNNVYVRAMKKVLLITYYWPPSGGAGVQRVLKTAKYLRSFGWEPIIYTAQNAAYPILDPSLLEDVPDDLEVLQGEIWEPYELYKRFTGQKEKKQVYSGFMSDQGKQSFTQKLSIWIRGNFFIPDARKFWIKPSIKFLRKYLKEHPVDAIMSSGPPHSVHMIAKGLREQLDIPWLADFRDPWTNIDFYDQLRLSKWADRRHRKMEKAVMDSCDALSTVSWVWKKEFEELGAKQVRVITNGFDDADFQAGAPPLSENFLCSHIGFLNQDRNSSALWQAFGELAKEMPLFREKLKLRFIGKTDPLCIQQLHEQALGDCIEQMSYVPHNEVLQYTRASQVLMLLVNDVPNVMGHIPGKTYEYIGSRRPVLGIGPADADFARVLQESKSGTVCGFEDKEGMKRALFKLFSLYKKGKLQNDEADIDRFTRKYAAGQIAQYLSKISEA
ncbi:MAG: glycosyltransferase [Bacteroidota bacterium]